MDIFATNLRLRALQLGMHHAEVARRVGLNERRYAHYVAGRSEPDLAMLVRIAEVLQSTPNELLGLAAEPERSARDILVDRLNAAAAVMADDDLRAAVAQAEAVIAMRRG